MIEHGMGKLNRLSSKALKIITSAEDKHLKRKVLFQQREQAVVAKEQALANREEELAGRLGPWTPGSNGLERRWRSSLQLTTGRSSRPRSWPIRKSARSWTRPRRASAS